MTNGQIRIFRLFLILTVGLIVLSFLNYELYRFSAETMTVFLGIMLFVTASNSKVYSERTVLLALGLAYLYIGLIDMLSIISVDSFGLLSNTTLYSSRILYIAARAMEAADILIIFYIYRKTRIMNYSLSNVTHAISFIIILLIVFTGTIETYALASRVVVRWVVESGIILILGLGIFYASKMKMSVEYKSILIASIILKMLSILTFSLTNLDTSILSMISHLTRFLSYGGFYAVFVSQTLSNPYENVSKVFMEREEDLLVKIDQDPLTGILNHSATYKKLEELVKKYKGQDKSIFVTVIDIDDFKIVNDSFGHQLGDEVLKEFTQILVGSKYEDKVIGRYGGDEFVIAGKYDKRIDSYERFVVFNKKLSAMNEKLKVKITFSAGTAIYNEGDEARDLVYKADVKMYESKRKGKNQVSVWD